jgi:hypothetical protein
MTPDLRGVAAPDEKGRSIEWVDWTDLDLDEEQIAIQIAPASSLPKSFPGRLQKVIELGQAGMDKRWAMSLLEDPDLDKYTRLENAPLEDLVATMEHMLETGDYIEPGDYQDCALGIRIAQRFWSLAKMAKRPENLTANLELWMHDAAKKLEQGLGKPPEPMAAPATPAGPGAPNMPGMGGGAPPMPPMGA